MIEMNACPDEMCYSCLSHNKGAINMQSTICTSLMHSIHDDRYIQSTIKCKQRMCDDHEYAHVRQVFMSSEQSCP